jgi:hypothetical protein
LQLLYFRHYLMPIMAMVVVIGVADTASSSINHPLDIIIRIRGEAIISPIIIHNPLL